MTTGKTRDNEPGVDDTIKHYQHPVHTNQSHNAKFQEWKPDFGIQLLCVGVLKTEIRSKNNIALRPLMCTERHKVREHNNYCPMSYYSPPTVQACPIQSDSQSPVPLTWQRADRGSPNPPKKKPQKGETEDWICQ